MGATGEHRERDFDRLIHERLEGIETPTPIIWGAQDRILPVKQGCRAARELHDARRHVLDQCRHVPTVERTDDFNTLTADFLSDGLSAPPAYDGPRSRLMGGVSWTWHS